MADSQEAVDPEICDDDFNRFHRFQQRLSGLCEAVTSFSAPLWKPASSILFSSSPRERS